MHIKEVVLSGFKSYRETTNIKDLDPGYNVIVGRNGSGKSNFFAALEFALRSDTRALRREERNALLFNGDVGHEVAFVEVVFDNTDRKLPYNTDIVTFKRLIGAKKDKFYVNKKEGHNIKEFLDSAGISNPYYIVRQGKINEMALMTEKARLQILYDISGSKVYDEKKIKANKVLQDCEKKMKVVIDLIESLDKSLEGLTHRAEELQSYEKLDKKKRAVEYLVHNREKINIISKNEKLQLKHEQLIAQCEPAQKEILDLKQRLEDIEHELSKFEQRISFHNSKKKDIDNELPVTLARIALIENQMKDTENNLKTAVNSEKTVEKILKKLEDAEAQLKRLEDETSRLKKEEIVKQDSYISCKTELFNIKEKCGRTAQFTSKSERDAWIRSEIQKLDLLLNEGNSVVQSHEETSADIQKELDDLNHKHEEAKKNWDLYRNKVNELESSNVNTDHNVLMQKRSELWSEVNKIEQELSLTNGLFTRLMVDLRKSCGSASVHGWQSIQTVLKKLREGNKHEHIVNGYHGCEPDLYTAVEVSGGRNLMYHIVDSHEISRVIMKEFNKSKLNGEIAFISLSEIMDREWNYSSEQHNSSPLITHISSKSKFFKAINYVFGGTMLCDSLETASYVAKNRKMNCVTLDGDKVLQKGPITGGYMNKQSSKIDLCNQLLAEKKRIEQFTADIAALQNKLHVLEGDIVSCNSQKEKIESKLCSLRMIFEKVQIEKDLCERQIHYNKSKFQQELVSIQNLRTVVKNYVLKKEKLEEELTEQMSEKNNQTMRMLKTLKASLKKKEMEAENSAEVHKRKEAEKKSAEESIKKMEQEIEQLKLSACTTQSTKIILNDLTRQLNTLKDIKMKQQNEWDHVTNQCSGLQKEMKKIQSAKEKELESEAEKKNQLDEIRKELERIFQIQSEGGKLLAEVREAMLKLGTVPAEVQKYEGKSTKELCKILSRISESMLKFGKINRKATEKLEKAKQVHEDLMNSRNKYMEMRTKIADLDKTLDDKKGEAVFNVFKSVHHQFRKIFVQLVPKGDIRMFLRTSSGGQIDGISVESGEKVFSMFRENKFEGLAIDVNFLGKQIANCQDIRSLSGGQKSLISLALLLAIQRCDPVPLYIFDEVDQALDKKHRSAVAALIKELSKNAQFICTTFSRQFIDKSDAAFGVCFQNQASKLVPITVEKALAFVQNDTDSSIEEPESDEVSSRRARERTNEVEVDSGCSEEIQFEMGGHEQQSDIDIDMVTLNEI